MKQEYVKAPELIVQKWLNSDAEISLDSLKGKVVVIFAFQMLCPGCVENSIPQAKNVHAIFNPQDVAVLGLHTVFEHHDAMTEVSLKAFLHEYRLSFPVAIDQPSTKANSPLPETMSLYGMGGTPTLILVDRKGYLRKHKMGHEQDLIVGAEIMNLVNGN